MPCIIHWNFNHFVVLEGIDGDRVYINDPAIGRRRIDMAELDLAFTGVVLTMEPTEAFRKLGSKPQGLRLLLRELRGSKPAVGLLVMRQLRAGRAQYRSRGIFKNLRRRHSDPAHHQLARSAADRHGRDRDVPRHPDACCANRCC